MQVQKKNNQKKKVKVRIQAGFGSSLNGKFSMANLSNLSPSDLAQKMIAENINSSDMRTKSIAESLSGIINDPTSDIDMRFRTKEDVIPTSVNRLKEEKIEELAEKEQVNLNELEEMELAASRMAKGGI
jgi:hypothetical protein